jgi:hypothetical protein
MGHTLVGPIGHISRYHKARRWCVTVMERQQRQDCDLRLFSRDGGSARVRRSPIPWSTSARADAAP